MTDELRRVILDYGAFALLAFIVLHALRVTLPGMMTTFATELEKQRVASAHAQAAMIAAFEREQVAVRLEMRTLYGVLIRRFGTRHEGDELIEPEGDGT